MRNQELQKALELKRDKYTTNASQVGVCIYRGRTEFSETHMYYFWPKRWVLSPTRPTREEANRHIDPKTRVRMYGENYAWLRNELLRNRQIACAIEIILAFINDKEVPNFYRDYLQNNFENALLTTRNDPESAVPADPLLEIYAKYEIPAFYKSERFLSKGMVKKFNPPKENTTITINDFNRAIQVLESHRNKKTQFADFFKEIADDIADIIRSVKAACFKQSNMTTSQTEMLPKQFPSNPWNRSTTSLVHSLFKEEKKQHPERFNLTAMRL